MNSTKKGMKKALRNCFNDLRIPKPKKWDGFWRMVIFDIPHKLKWARDGFRHKLEDLGFYQFQKSVFVFPYPCREEVNFLVFVFCVSSYVRFLKTNQIDDDAQLKKQYNL